MFVRRLMEWIGLILEDHGMETDTELTHTSNLKSP